MIVCPTCGLPAVDAEAVVNGTARYADSLGGHADRHPLVVEDAERALSASAGGES